VNFTLRQWGVIVGLSLFFFVTAYVVSQGEPEASTAIDEKPFDEIVWCEKANALSQWRTFLDGSVDGDSANDIANLRNELDGARDIAPVELRPNMARLFDYSLLVTQAIERNDGDLDAALSEAQTSVDMERINESIGLLSESIVACGHEGLTE